VRRGDGPAKPACHIPVPTCNAAAGSRKAWFAHLACGRRRGGEQVVVRQTHTARTLDEGRLPAGLAVGSRQVQLVTSCCCCSAEGLVACGQGLVNGARACALGTPSAPGGLWWSVAVARERGSPSGVLECILPSGHQPAHVLMGKRRRWSLRRLRCRRSMPSPARRNSSGGRHGKPTRGLSSWRRTVGPATERQRSRAAGKHVKYAGAKSGELGWCVRCAEGWSERMGRACPVLVRSRVRRGCGHGIRTHGLPGTWHVPEFPTHP
jgi:hypothetical protein